MVTKPLIRFACASGKRPGGGCRRSRQLGWRHRVGLLLGLFFGAVLAIPGSYLGMVVIGVPTYLVLSKLGLLRLWIFCTLGALMPLLVFLGAAPLRTTLMAVAAGAAVGASAFFCFPADRR